MGYYSNFEYDKVTRRVVIDPKLRDKLEELYSDENNDEIYGFYNVRIKLNPDNTLYEIKLDDTYGKFYDQEDFAADLSRIIKEGKVRLMFWGEDGHNTAYHVSHNRVVIMNTLEYEPQMEEYITECMKRYKAMGIKEEENIIPSTWSITGGK